MRIKLTKMHCMESKNQLASIDEILIAGTIQG